MKRPGWNPIRRNRKIGRPGHGAGRDNRLVIPERWSEDRVWFEKLRNPVKIVRTISGHVLTFLVEPTNGSFVHSCTVDDIATLLDLLPMDLVEAIDLFVLRQPTRKDKIMQSSWGRIVYWANLDHFSGTTIYLDAQEPGETIKWRKSVSPDCARELERLSEDGHKVELKKRNYEIATTLASIRATQLYRTTIHEVGHLDDWFRSGNSYDTKTSVDKEAYAHRFADERRTALIKEGKIPFDRMVDIEQMNNDGLNPDWFLEN